MLETLHEKIDKLTEMAEKREEKENKEGEREDNSVSPEKKTSRFGAGSSNRVLERKIEELKKVVADQVSAIDGRIDKIEYQQAKRFEQVLIKLNDLLDQADY